MTGHAVLEYVANSVWQVPVLAGMAWLAIRWGKPEPRVQYRMWIGTLALAVVLPLIRPAALHVYIPRTAQDQLAAPARGISIVPFIGEEQALHREDIAQAETGSAKTGDTGGASRPVKSESANFPHSIQLNGIVWNWLLAIYFAIVLFRLAYLARSRRAAGKLLRNARKSVLSPLEHTVLERCCEKLGVTASRVLFSRETRTPMAIGSNRPAVLLPESFHTCTEEEMQAILCHELAHVRRGDYLANWICQLGSLPIAYHPATYGIDREIRRSRELTCDAMAAAAMGSPVGYAGCLVRLARQIEDESGANGPAASGSAASGLFDHDVFEERIMKLLERKSGSGRTTAWRMTGSVALIAGAAVCAAALHITPVVRAAETSVTIQQTATSAPTQIARSQEQVPMKKTIRAQGHGAIPPKPQKLVKAAAPVDRVVPLTAIAPLQSGMPMLPTMPLRAVVPIAELAEPLQRLDPLQDVPPAKPTPPSLPSVPKAEPMPSPSEPTPASLLPPQQPAPVKPPAIAHPDHDFKGAGITFDMTPEEHARMDRELAAATARIQAQTKVLNNPEFKKQMADMQRQVQEATKQMQSARFQQQVKYLQSPEFKKQMEDAQRQMQEATKQLRSAEFQAQVKYLQSPEFKKQMADMQRQVQEATKQMQSARFQQQAKYLQSPEFKKQMEDAQRQMQEATKQMQSARFQEQVKYLQSPEFKKQMEDAQRQVQDSTRSLGKDRMQLEMKQMPKRGTPVTPSNKDNSVPR